MRKLNPPRNQNIAMDVISVTLAGGAREELSIHHARNAITFSNMLDDTNSSPLEITLDWCDRRTFAVARDFLREMTINAERGAFDELYDPQGQYIGPQLAPWEQYWAANIDAITLVKAFYFAEFIDCQEMRCVISSAIAYRIDEMDDKAVDIICQQFAATK